VEEILHVWKEAILVHAPHSLKTEDTHGRLCLPVQKRGGEGGRNLAWRPRGSLVGERERWQTRQRSLLDLTHSGRTIWTWVYLGHGRRIYAKGGGKKKKKSLTPLHTHTRMLPTAVAHCRRGAAWQQLLSRHVSTSTGVALRRCSAGVMTLT